MADKVHGGTPVSGPNLCETCAHCVSVKGYSGSHEFYHCTWFQEKVIPFSLRQCNKYTNSATPDLAEMKKIAWVIESRNRGTWGFVGGKKQLEERIEVVVRPPGKDD